MTRCGLLALVGLLACGRGGTPVREPELAEAEAGAVTEPVAAVDAGPSPEPLTVSPSSVPMAPLAPVGHLTGAHHLAHLFSGLGALAGPSPRDDVHILQIGDSHTASDLGVAVLRRALQARFGDGGRGFVSIGQPWTGYVQEGIHGTMDHDFEPVFVSYRGGRFIGEGGCYGLLGIAIGSSVAGARAWTDVAEPSTRVEIAYRVDDAGGTFDVLVDHARVETVSTRPGANGAGGFAAVDVAAAPHRVEVRASGDGPVVVYGMTLDRPEAGVVVDALGINGAQYFTPLRWGEACYAAQLRHAEADLVILAYGTNEALETGLTDAAFERAMVDLLGRVARSVPASSCLVLGPPDLARKPKGTQDYRTIPRISEIVALEKRVAEAAGCAFYDQMEAMGGAGSIDAWASEDPPRAGKGRVHLTKLGYAALATSFANDLMQAFDRWRTAGPAR